MNAAPALRGLSISTRSFLLVLAALFVAEGIALALFISRPPLRNAPVAVSGVAELLRVDPERGPGQPGSGPFGPRGFGPREPGPRDFGPPPGGTAPDRGPPPPGFSGPPSGPGPLAPAGRDPGARLRIEEGTSPPSPIARVDIAQSRTVTRMLAQRLRVGEEDLRVMLPVDRHGPRQDRPGDRMLGEGFVISRHLPDGRWRTVTSVVEGFPNAFQRQALLLFGMGAALLLPLAWLFARALSAPIRRFAEGARRLGHDPVAAPLQRTGPPEMQSAVDAFNAMQARIQRLLQERTQMIAAIAHDLRTPLTRLAFRLEDLPAPLGEKVSADILEMKQMISAALDFSRERSTAGARERLDLRALIERVVDDHGDLGQDVLFEPGTPVIVEGVPLALRRMLTNLVENALKYGERARLRLHTAGEMAIIEIDDDGPGIPVGRQDEVFEPFFRLESSRNRDTGGIGLGLATVRAIVLDHGGEVGLGNRSGGGLRVTVRLPLLA